MGQQRPPHPAHLPTLPVPPAHRRPSMGPAALLLALLLHLSVGAAPPHPAPAVIDVARQYGNISFASIRGAMEHAQGIVASGGSAVIFLAAGEHTVDMAGGALFDVSGVTPGPGG